MRSIKFVTIIAGAILLCSCQEELNNEIDSLRTQVSSLEETVKTLQNDISAISEIVTALEKNVLISSVVKTSDGYRITFSDNTSITIKNGKNGNTPIVGVKYDESLGIYYWTVRDGENGTEKWMRDNNNQRIRATGVVPVVRIENGYWKYSFDGINFEYIGGADHKIPATGSDGGSMFSSVENTGNIVVFTLTNGQVFSLPTMDYFQTLVNKVNEVNSNIDSYIELANSPADSIFVESISEIVENGEIKGYDITLADGKVLNIRNAVNDSSMIYLSIASRFEIDADGNIILGNYWKIKESDDDSGEWLRYNGEMISADPKDGIPVLGAKDSSGVIYFTVKVGDGEVQFVRDSLGNPVQASGKLGFRFFDSFRQEGSSVVVTLADGSELSLCKAHKAVPSLALSSEYAEVETDSLYVIKLLVKDTLAMTTPYASASEYAEAGHVSFSAVAVDNGYVTGPTVTEDGFVSTPVIEGERYAYEVAYELKYRTGKSDFVVGQLSRVAVFMTFDDKVVMKTMEFTNVPPTLQ